MVFADSSFFGIGSALLAEIRALKRGLQHCSAQGFSAFDVRCDSQILVQFMLGRTAFPWQYADELQETQLLLRSTSSRIFHCFRETNMVADALAKFASSSCLTRFFSSSSTLPMHFQRLVRMDQLAFPNIRRIVK